MKKMENRMIFVGILAIIVIVGIKVGTAYALGDIHIHLAPWPKCWPGHCDDEQGPNEQCDPDSEDCDSGGG
jgi:hypothetical protein